MSLLSAIACLSTVDKYPQEWIYLATLIHLPSTKVLLSVAFEVSTKSENWSSRSSEKGSNSNFLKVISSELIY